MVNYLHVYSLCMLLNLLTCPEDFWLEREHRIRAKRYEFKPNCMTLVDHLSVHGFLVLYFYF